MFATAALLSLALAGGGANDASGVQVVKPVDGVKGGKVTVGVNIDDAKSTAVRKAREGVVANVVRTLVDSGAEEPQRVRGYKCTPTVKGATGMKVQWTCTYTGGRPRTTVELDFGYTLTGHSH